MSVFNFNARNVSPGVGVADTVALTTNTFMALQGAAATQRTNVLEVFIEGESTASAVSYLTMAHDTTIGVAAFAALVSPNSNGTQNPNAGALANPVVAYISAGTQPQRATTVTLPKIPFSINAFGGVLKWNPWQPNMSYGMLGNTQPLGEISLSAFTGSSALAQVSAHIMYETD
jgi:hypothetical protein